MNYSLSRLERLYLQLQTAFNLIPNASGTATVSGSDACRFTKCTINNDVAAIVRQDKTGSRTATIGDKGRAHCNWTVEMSLVTNGTTTLAPDADPILQSLFGGPPAVNSTGSTIAISSSTNASPIVVTATAHGLTVGTNHAVRISGHLINTAANGVWVATATDANTLTLLGSTGNGIGAATGNIDATSVQYSLQEPVLPTFAMYSFRQPSTLTQRAAFGCAVTSATWTLGQDVAMASYEGEGLYSLESSYFSIAEDEVKGGLTTFPAEPAGPVTNGNIIVGFTGGLIIGGNKVSTLRTATVKYNSGADVIKDLFGTFVPDSVEADERTVTIALSLYDADDTVTSAIRNAGQTKTPIDVFFVSGTKPGSTILWYLKNVQFAISSLDDGQRRFVLSIPESRAYGTPNVGKDELTMWML